MLRSGILMCAISLVFLYPAIAQSQFDIEIPARTSFSEVLLSLSLEHDLDFAYPSEEFELLNLEPLHYQCDSLEDLISYLCGHVEVEYRKINDNQILLRKIDDTNSEPYLNQNFTFLPMEVTISPILILDYHPFFMLNGIRFHPEHISKTGGFLGTDLLKNIQLSSGISADNDMDADIRIRGSQGDETLIVLDEIPIINSNHYWGIFSNINPEYVDDIQLYKNALPITYTGATGGMVLMHSNNNPTEFNGKISTSLLTSSAHLEIPIKNLSIQVAGRTSNNNLSDNGLYEESKTVIENRTSANGKRQEVISSSIPEFKFNDFNANVAYQITSKDRLQFNIFSSNDVYDLQQNIEFTTIFNDKEFSTNKRYSEVSEWKNRGLSLTYERELSQTWDMKLIGSKSKYTDEINFLTSLERNNPERLDLENKFYNFNEFSIAHLKLHTQYKPSSLLSFQFGSEVKKSSTALNITKREDSKLNLDNEKSEYHYFTSSRFSLFNLKLITDVGIRSTYYNGTKKWYQQPQLSSRYIHSDNVLFKMSLSRQFQFANELTHEDNFGRTFEFFTLSNGLNLPVKSSNNLMLGIEISNTKWSLDMEAYYKDIDGKIQHLTRIPGFVEGEETNSNGYQLIRGTGNVIGIDTRLNYVHRQFSTSIAYTLSKSTDQYPSVYQGSSFRSANDRRHQLKLLNQIQHKSFNYYFNFIYSSGLPYNDISLLMEGLDREDLSADAFIKQLPYYGRVDVGLEKEFRFKELNFNVGAHVFNLFNRQNVHALQYIYSIPNSHITGPENINTVIGTEVDQLGRTLNIELGLRF